MKHPFICLTPWIAALCLSSACTDAEFPVYNELEGVRVLGIRAQPADARPGDDTVVDALLHFDGKRSVERSWTVCPWPSDPNEGFRCPVSEASWRAAWESTGLTGDPVPLELGSADSASIHFPDDDEGLRSLCHELLDRLGAGGSAPPSCEQEWKWTFRLHVRSGEHEIETIKDVRLVLDDDPLNQNPAPSRLRVQTNAGLRVLDGLQLKADDEHELRVDIDEAAAESYERRAAPGENEPKAKREALTFTWFVEGGSTDRVRSFFGDDFDTLRAATRNDWHTPDESREARVYVVVRDDRGGIGWQTGTASIRK
jgi:hypothetical protein